MTKRGLLKLVTKKPYLTIETLYHRNTFGVFHKLLTVMARIFAFTSFRMAIALP